jgi:preprotein translocase subunit YajC
MKDQLMSSLVAAGSSSSGSSSLLIFALPVLLIGFMFITQRRRQKAAQALQSTLGVGDEITTTSGMLGRITALDDKLATLEVSPGVSVRFDRRAIAGPAPSAQTSSDSRTDVQSDPTSSTD